MALAFARLSSPFFPHDLHPPCRAKLTQADLGGPGCGLQTIGAKHSYKEEEDS
jgi:hypothetical protein